MGIATEKKGYCLLLSKHSTVFISSHHSIRIPAAEISLRDEDGLTGRN